MENSRIRYRQLGKQNEKKLNESTEFKNILKTCIHEYFQGQTDEPTKWTWRQEEQKTWYIQEGYPWSVLSICEECGRCSSTQISREMKNNNKLFIFFEILGGGGHICPKMGGGHICPKKSKNGVKTALRPLFKELWPN